MKRSVTVPVTGIYTSTFSCINRWTVVFHHQSSSATSISFRKPNNKLPVRAKTLFHPEVQCPSAGHNRYLNPTTAATGNCIVIVSSFTVLSSRFAAHWCPCPYKNLPGETYSFIFHSVGQRGINSVGN